MTCFPITTASLMKVENLKSDHSTYFHSLLHGIILRENSTYTKTDFYNQNFILKMLWQNFGSFSTKLQFPSSYAEVLVWHNYLV